MAWLFHKLLAICMLCAAVGACAQPPVPTRVQPNSGAAATLTMTLVEDQAGTLTLREILAGKAGKFQPGSYHVGLTTSAYWLRFTINNPGAQAREWWFDTGNRTLQEIDFYYPDGEGGWLRQSTGTRDTFVSRPLPTDSFVFALPATATESEAFDVYLRVRSTGYLGITMAPQLWDPAAYQRQAERDTSTWLAYLGLATLLGVINLVLWLTLRDRNYLLYVLSLASIVAAICCMAGGFGSAYRMFWPESPVFEQCVGMLTQLPATWMPVLFAFSLMNLWHSMPRLCRLLVWLMAPLSVLMLAQVAGMALQQTELAPVLQGLYLLGWLFWLPIYPAIVYAVLRESWRGNRLARFFCVAYIPMIAVAAMISTQVFRGEPSTMSNLLWASAFELLVMALALADRWYRARKLAVQDGTDQPVAPGEPGEPVGMESHRR